MTALQTVAQEWAKSGWSIRSIDDAQFIAARKKGPSGLLIVVGLLLTPVLIGLLLIVLAFIARGEETRLVTVAEAEAWLRTHAENQARYVREAEDRKAKREARMTSATGLALVWYSVPENTKIVLLLGTSLVVGYGLIYLLTR